MKERIIFRLLNFEKNRKLLKDVPFIRFCDLAVVFHVLLKADTEGEIAMLIHKEHMHRWDKNLSALDLMELAQGNTPRLLPASVRKMGEVLSDISSELGEKEGAEKAPIMDGLGKNIPMYVVSNSSGLCGASVVLYPNVLRQLAWKTRSDLVVFPSSRHEVLVTPLEDDTDFSELREMVRTVNDTTLQMSDFLSNQVYLYMAQDDEVHVV